MTDKTFDKIIEDSKALRIDLNKAKRKEPITPKEWQLLRARCANFGSAWGVLEVQRVEADLSTTVQRIIKQQREINQLSKEFDKLLRSIKTDYAK